MAKCTKCKKEINKDNYEYNYELGLLKEQVGRSGIKSLTKEQKAFLDEKLCIDCLPY